MILTEEEAKTKLCVKMSVLDPVALCCGSKCMAWQWTEKKRFDTERQLLVETGYCGLAGGPREEIVAKTQHNYV